MPARSKMVGVWETGEGERVPPPRQPHPKRDIPTVHSMGRSWRRAGYGCSPDIATHGPCPPLGAGAERRRRGRGGGRQKGMGIPCRKRGRGGGRQKGMGIPCRKRGRGGGRQKRMGILLRRRGWGGCRRGTHGYPITKRGRSGAGEGPSNAANSILRRCTRVHYSMAGIKTGEAPDSGREPGRFTQRTAYAC